MVDIVGMLHRFRDSIYKNAPSPKWEKTRPYPFENMFDAIAKKALIPVDEIYDRLTMEQLWRYSDKIVYDSYETFPEGKTVNIYVMTKKWLTEEQKNDLEIIKRFR
jgi:hypothetical protein